MAAEKKVELSSDVEKSPSDEAAPDAPAAILKHGLDADEAMKAFVGHDVSNLVLDDETSKRILRKIDLNIMPVREWANAFVTIVVSSDALLLDGCSKAHWLRTCRSCASYTDSTTWTRRRCRTQASWAFKSP